MIFSHVKIIAFQTDINHIAYIGYFTSLEMNVVYTI